MEEFHFQITSEYEGLRIDKCRSEERREGKE